MSIDRATLLEAARVCGCFNLRRAARAVTRLYDEVLEPGGLRSTGFVALAFIRAEKTITLPRLARALGVDRSTLTRNLRPLERQGLVRVSRPANARAASARVTAKGEQVLARCVPLWKVAQGRFESCVGPQRWAAVLAGLDAIARAAPDA